MSLISYTKEVEAGGSSIDFNWLNGMLHSTSKNKDYRSPICAVAPVCSIHNAPLAPLHLHSSCFQYITTVDEVVVYLLDFSFK